GIKVPMEGKDQRTDTGRCFRVNVTRVLQMSGSRQVLMRTCRQINHALIDYCSGELVPDEQACFEAHLALCLPCVVYLSSYETTLWPGKGGFGEREEIGTEDVLEALVRAILGTCPRVQR